MKMNNTTDAEKIATIVKHRAKILEKALNTEKTPSRIKIAHRETLDWAVELLEFLSRHSDSIDGLYAKTIEGE